MQKCCPRKRNKTNEELIEIQKKVSGLLLSGFAIGLKYSNVVLTQQIEVWIILLILFWTKKSVNKGSGLKLCQCTDNYNLELE